MTQLNVLRMWRPMSKAATIAGIVAATVMSGSIAPAQTIPAAQPAQQNRPAAI
jgi:hypothetical protein